MLELNSMLPLGFELTNHRHIPELMIYQTSFGYRYCIIYQQAHWEYSKIHSRIMHRPWAMDPPDLQMEWQKSVAAPGNPAAFRATNP